MFIVHIDFYKNNNKNLIILNIMCTTAKSYAILVLLTVNFLKIRTPKTFVVITLKFELCGSANRVMSPNDSNGMANSVDPDQTAPRSSLI